MSITIKNYIRNAVLALLMIVPLLVVAPANAQTEIQTGLCAGTELGTASTGCTTDGGAANSKVNQIIKLVINIFSIIVGVVSVIMIIIGGLKYITSAGDSNNVTSAKNTILYAIIGLVVVALAQVIVRFVLGNAAFGDQQTL